MNREANETFPPLLTLAALVASAYHWVASRAKDWLLPPPPLVLPPQEPAPQESA